MTFNDTRIYRKALDLVSLSHMVIAGLPVGCGFLADQLRRASASVALNFAEGCGKPSPADRRRFCMIAKGSSYEVAAIFDVALRLKAVRPELHLRAADMCDHLAAMLHNFCR